MRKGETVDLAVIGAGIFGLSAAWAASRRGLRVTVFEAAPAPGAGASGTPVGALVPFGPSRWDACRAFQRDALARAPAHWRAVAAASGRDPGYRAAGRLRPLASEAARARAEADAAAAAAAWGGRWDILAPGAAPQLVNPAAAPFGLLSEGVSAAIDPRRALPALAAAAAAAGAEIRYGCAVPDPSGPLGGGTVAAARVALCTGAAAVAALGPGAVGAVKGQAAVLAADLGPGAPVIEGGGLYVVGHGPGHVAVGATRERGRRDPGTDDRLEALLARARALVPRLRGAAVLERWAGLRPRAPLAVPMVGPVPGGPAFSSRPAASASASASRTRLERRSRRSPPARRRRCRHPSTPRRISRPFPTSRGGGAPGPPYPVDTRHICQEGVRRRHRARPCSSPVFASPVSRASSTRPSSSSSAG